VSLKSIIDININTFIYQVNFVLSPNFVPEDFRDAFFVGGEKAKVYNTCIAPQAAAEALFMSQTELA